MEGTTYQRELTALVRELLKRCPPEAACSELFNCLDGDDYDKIGYCCEAWQRAHEGSFDWWAQGVAHMQRGILYGRDGTGRSGQALKALDKAESIFGIYDDVCTALALMASGRILESRGNRINSEGKDQWEKAAQAYLRAREKLDRVGHPLTGLAQEWWMGAVRRLRQEVPPPRGEKSQPAAPEAGQAAGEQGTPQGAEARAEQPGAPEAAQLAEQGVVEQGEPPAANAGTGQPVAQEAEPPPQEETRPGGPAFLYPPSHASRLRLIRVCANKVRAGEPVEMAIEMGEKLEATTLDVGGTEFYVRDTPGRKDLDYLDVFDFALPVTGDSMEPVIHDGDYILVSKAERHGEMGGGFSKDEMVVARAPRGAEDEFTVKRYFPRTYQRRGGEAIKYILLRPENEARPSIILLETDKQKQALEDHLRSEYGDEVIIIVADTRGAIEGRVSVILSPVHPEPAEG